MCRGGKATVMLGASCMSDRALLNRQALFPAGQLREVRSFRPVVEPRIGPLAEGMIELIGEEAPTPEIGNRRKECR